MQKLNMGLTFYLSLFFFCTGVLLLTINIYGLFKSIEPSNIKTQHYRFKSDDPFLTFQESLRLLEKKQGETESTFTRRANETISRRISHIHWFKYDNTTFNQLVPVWENYFLYLIGKFVPIPEFQRYHYVDHVRSLKRGIGVCGDKAMALSQVLNKESIQNRIISFARHVVIEVKFKDNQTIVYDPDFGIEIPFSIERINNNPSKVETFYKSNGQKKGEIKDLISIYATPFQYWQDTRHFITKKYWLEKITYFLKWPLPIALVLTSLYFGLPLIRVD